MNSTVRSLLLLSTCLGLNTSSAQLGRWEFQNPRPGPNGLNALCVAAADTVYVGGWGGLIARTFDGGVNWKDCSYGQEVGISALEFTDGRNGFTNGELGELYKTTDAGDSWTLIRLPDPTWYVATIEFVDEQVGYIGGMTFGANGDSSFVARTNDGGVTWAELDVNHMPSALAQIQAFSVDTVYTLGFGEDFAGTLFSYSHDGGMTWSEVFPLPNLGSEDWTQGTMHFLDHQEGYLYCNAPDTILRTTDGGHTWEGRSLTGLPAGSDFFPGTLHYFDQDNAVAFASYGANPIVTTDGGATWTQGVHASITSWLYRMLFAPGTRTGYVVGGGGEILKTTDGGLNWETVQRGFRQTQWGVHFKDSMNGFMCGNSGTLHKTTDGGASFTALESGVSVRLTSIHGAGNSLFVCGQGGTILKSTDDGEVWVAQNSTTTKNLNGISFRDGMTGVAVGDEGTILRTVDGGATWTVLDAGISAKLNSVEVRDAYIYIAGDADAEGQSLVYYSHDLGASFSQALLTDVDFNMYDIDFVNDSTGRVCGDFGSIFKTTDHGNTWLPELTNTTDELFGIDFADAEHGIAVGNYGLIHETSDGGATWAQNLSVVHVQLNAVSYPHRNSACAVGVTGTVAGYTNSFSTVGINDHGVERSGLALYPIPAGAYVNIEAGEKPRSISLYEPSGKLIDVIAPQGSLTTYVLSDRIMPGLYFLQVVDQRGNVVSGRLVVSK